MRAVTISEPGGPEGLGWGEVPDPVCGAGEVIVDVAATAVNRADLLQRQGFYPPPPGASEILGLECSGIVSEVGEGVTGWSVGDEVCALLSGGGYAERVAVPAGQLLPRPAGGELATGGGRPQGPHSPRASNWPRRGRCPRSPAPSGPTCSCWPGSGGATASWCTAGPAASARWPS